MKRKNRIPALVMSMAIALAVMIFGGGTALAEGGFAGGTGTFDDPWLIETPEQLASIAEAVYRASHFKLTADIDLSTYLSEGGGGWNGGEGWQPIGVSGSPFTGSLDGAGHSISGLFINRSGTDYQGLFGYLGSAAVIQNVELVDVDVTGKNYVGGLAGANSGTVTGSNAAGDVTGSDYVGGLVARNDNNGKIEDSNAACGVTGSLFAGGLVSNNYGEVTGSHAAGNVTGPNYVGGLVGNNNGEVTGSHATGDVTGSGNNVGGLVARNQINSIIEDSYATGDVTGSDYVGGLIGVNYGEVTGSYAAGIVTGKDGVGGLVGYNNGSTVTNSYAAGTVTGRNCVGGLCGSSHSKIINCYSTCAVTSEYNVGGLVGANDHDVEVTASYYDKETAGQDDDENKGIPKTTEDMNLRSTYESWDFVDIWGIEDEQGYPLLRWQDGAPQSGFNILAEGPVIVEIGFELDISQAKGGDGNPLNGTVSAMVYSDMEGEYVVESGINFSGGEAAVPVTLDTSGIHNLRIYVDGVSYSNLLTVELLTVESIEVTNPPDKSTYYVGEELDLTGLEVTGTLSDDSTVVLEITEANISDFDSSAPAEGQVVTVTYGGKTATFTVEIEQATLESIAITTPPAKLTYTVGDALDITGMVVTGTYSDNSTEELALTLDNISGFDSTVPAEGQVVTVTYEGKTATFTVIVKALESIAITTPPARLTYTVGDALDITGMVVTGTYSGNSTEELAITLDNISGFDSSAAAADQVVTVTYEGKTATFTVDIVITNSGGGGGGGGGTQSPAPATAVDSRGNITTVPKLDQNTGVAEVEIDSNTLATAFARAAKDSEGKKTVKIEMSTVKDALAYEFILPASALTSSDVNKQLKIKTGIAAVTLPANMLTQETAAGAENISLIIAQADVSGLDEETRSQIGDRPVIQLSLKLDGEPYPWSNESAPVTVSIPYTPTEEELADPEHITVWHIDGAGNVVEVPSGRYDPATGAVTFSTTHFGSFAVVYVTKTFDDLESVAWAKKPIEVLASKGILKGVSEKEYDPGANITRADFLYFLVRTLGVDARVEGNFDDLSRDAYYYKEIGIARKLGITSGIGDNKFSPDASITRQDMMVLTGNALRMLKKLEGQGTASDLDRFADKSLIAAYAVNGIASVVKEGLIVGSGDRINPLGNTTRAEAAVFLHRIYNKY